MNTRKLTRLLPLVLALAGFLTGAAASSRAADVKFPGDGSGVVFTLPAGYTSVPDDEGDLVITSADGQLSFSVVTSEPIKNPAAELKETGQAMCEKMNLTDVTGEASKEKTKPGGLKMITYGFQGKRRGARNTPVC